MACDSHDRLLYRAIPHECRPLFAPVSQIVNLQILFSRFRQFAITYAVVTIGNGNVTYELSTGGKVHAEFSAASAAL